MLYLMMHSKHFIRGYMASDIYSSRTTEIMRKGNVLPLHGLLFPVSSRGSFYIHHPTDRIAHTFVIPIVEEHWLEREISQWVHQVVNGESSAMISAEI